MVVKKDFEGRVVKNFGLERKHYRLFFDNCFTSHPLIKDLRKRQNMLVVE